MTQSTDVAVLVGSLRRASFSHRIAVALRELAPPPLTLDLIEIGELPLYNQDADDESRPPQEWETFRNRLRRAEAVLFVTPEYNRSLPGVLKNAVDVGSRPNGRSVWKGKPAGIVSVSPGSMGAFGANHHLRQSLVFLDMPTLMQPEVYLSGVAGLLGPDGSLASERTRGFLRNFAEAFATWIETVRTERNATDPSDSPITMAHGS